MDSTSALSFPLESLVATSSTRAIKDQLSHYFDSIPPDQGFSQLLSLLRANSNRDEQLAEVTAEAWDYLVTKQLWKVQYSSLEALQAELEFEQTLKSIIDRHQQTRARKKIEIKGIFRNWNALPEQAIPEEIMPPWMSDIFLKNLHQLSSRCSLEVSIPLLKSAIHARLGRSKTSKELFLQPVDIKRVVADTKALEATACSTSKLMADSALKSLEEFDDSSSDTLQKKLGRLRKKGDMSKEVQESSKKSVYLGDQDKDYHQVQINEKMVQGDQTREKNQEHGSGKEPSEQVQKLDGQLSQGGSGFLKPTGKDVVERDNESEDIQDVQETQAGLDVHRYSPDTIISIPLASSTDPRTTLSSFATINKIVEHPEPSGHTTHSSHMSDPLPSQPSLSCSCNSLLRQELDNKSGRLQDDKGLLLLHMAIKCRLNSLCHHHLRRLAKSSVGLKNNLPAAKIIHRLSLVDRHSRRLGEMRASYADWFIKECRPIRETDHLGIFRYPSIPPLPFKIDCRRTLERFAGPGSWKRWEDEGTIIIPNVFGYLNQPDILEMIDQEFTMYQHHAIPKPDRPRQGWCRNMYYSLIQQLVRQDPVWYAICAALQGKTELISHPYIAKDANPGEKTGFLHLDINVDKYLKSRSPDDNGNKFHLLSSSLSLDNETADGCTVVVPGFHRHIKTWFSRASTRCDTAGGFTTNCSNSYHKEDQLRWGKPQPVPCSAFSLRITRPDIIHGSTHQASMRRRTLFVWYRAIGADHETLEGPGTLTWSDLVACHRDMVIPVHEPSGQPLKHSLPKEPFAGAVGLSSCTALGDALVGRRRWTVPQVIREMEILLGADDEMAHLYIQNSRQIMLNQFRGTWELMKENEMTRFGDNSFFKQSQALKDMEMVDAN